MELSELMELAREASTRTYSPYSRFRVGAAIRTISGEVYCGGNIENASYGLSICAERNAATTMAFESPEAREIDVVAISSPDAAPCFPCGACRQFLREFDCKEVVVEDGEGKLLRFPFDEILPNSFGPESL